ncbi:hypothetical protein Tco_0070471 [Tanacetum coccineum]
MEVTMRKFMGESAKRHDENSKLIKEIQTLIDAAFQNQGTSIKTLEIQIGQISKLLHERGFGSLPSSTEPNPRDHVKSISTTIEANTYSIRFIYMIITVKKRRGTMDHNSWKRMELHISIKPCPERRKT